MKRSRTVIGRTKECDIRIPLDSVSRQQCELRIDDDEFVILQDLGSSNGTFLNDNRVQKIILEPGDKIRIGPVTFTMVIDGEPAHIEPIPMKVDHKKKSGSGLSPTGPVGAPPLMDDDDDDGLGDLLADDNASGDFEPFKDGEDDDADPFDELESLLDDDDDLAK